MSEIKIHAGCGKRNFGPGWFNVDLDNELPHVNWKNIFELPFKDNEAELIYASHLIAYISPMELPILLGEWKRVLKPGGTLRLATPDFEAMAGLYKKDLCTLQDIIGPLYGLITTMEGRNLYHKRVYDFTSLRRVLVDEAGFHSYKTYDWRDTEHAQFDDHSRAYLPKDPEAIASGSFSRKKHTLISLNVECKKPICAS